MVSTDRIYASAPWPRSNLHTPHLPTGLHRGHASVYCGHEESAPDGMSGTGKSTLIAHLAARGYRAIDTDTDAWSTWVEADGEPDWVWREDRIQHLLSTAEGAVLFVSGCKSNQGTFYAQFDHIVLLSAPIPVLVQRLATRTTNPYGKHPDDLARILEHVRRTACCEVDTRAPVEQVLDTILRHVAADAPDCSRSPDGDTRFDAGISP